MGKRRPWYRFLCPNDADFTVEKNSYIYDHKHNVYNPSNNYFTRDTNHFYDHLNE
jgi:hypothetical protein